MRCLSDHSDTTLCLPLAPNSMPHETACSLTLQRDCAFNPPLHRRALDARKAAYTRLKPPHRRRRLNSLRTRAAWRLNLLHPFAARLAPRIGALRDRAELPAGATLDAAIAVQFFMTLGKHPRVRLSAEEASELLETAVPANVPWLCSSELGKATVFRAMLAANRAPAEAVRHLRTLIDQAAEHAKLGPWISEKQLGFAVLAPSASSTATLEKAVEKSGLRQRAAIVVGLGPDAEHLSWCSNTLKAKSNSYGASCSNRPRRSDRADRDDPAAAL